MGFRLTLSKTVMGSRGAAGLLVAGVLLGAVAGCASMGSREPLSVSLVSLQVTDTTLFETSMIARLRITNLNLDPVEISGAYFKLYLDGGKVGDGTFQGPVTVDGLASTVVEVPFHVSHISVLRHAFTIMETEAVDWGLKTVVWVEGGMFGRHRVRIHDSGRLDLGQVMETAAGPEGEGALPVVPDVGTTPQPAGDGG